MSPNYYFTLSNAILFYSSTVLPLNGLTQFERQCKGGVEGNFSDFKNT
jgi:hypothetical protein